MIYEKLDAASKANNRSIFLLYELCKQYEESIPKGKFYLGKDISAFQELIGYPLIDSIECDGVESYKLPCIVKDVLLDTGALQITLIETIHSTLELVQNASPLSISWLGVICRLPDMKIQKDKFMLSTDMEAVTILLDNSLVEELEDCYFVRPLLGRHIRNFLGHDRCDEMLHELCKEYEESTRKFTLAACVLKNKLMEAIHDKLVHVQNTSPSSIFWLSIICRLPHMKTRKNKFTSSKDKEAVKILLDNSLIDETEADYFVHPLYGRYIRKFLENESSDNDDSS